MLPDSVNILNGITFNDDGKNLLTVNFAINNKQISKIVLQSLIEEFISDRVQNNRIAAIKGIEFVDDEIPKLRDQLSSAERDLSAFRSSGEQASFLIMKIEVMQLSLQIGKLKILN